MGFPRFDSGWCFDAASAPDERRTSGPSTDVSGVDQPTEWGTPSSPGGVITEPWEPTDAGPPVDEWKAANGYDGGASTGTKVSATGSFTITADGGGPGIARLDATGAAFVANMSGTGITISGATASDNNGLWQIAAVNSSTQLDFYNPDAVTVTESFTYDINASDNGYGADAAPTKSWRFDVDLPDGWYTRKTRMRKASEDQ
jgi:hypothetical protein